MEVSMKEYLCYVSTAPFAHLKDPEGAAAKALRELCGKRFKEKFTGRLSYKNRGSYVSPYLYLRVTVDDDNTVRSWLGTSINHAGMLDDNNYFEVLLMNGVDGRRLL